LIVAEWYERLFDGDYVRSYAMMNEVAEVHAENVLGCLGLAPGARVLDLAGGYGRVAIPIARRGYRVTVLDLSEEFIQLGKETARKAGVYIDWIRADMREVPQTADYDAVVNLYGSFGYLATDEENARVIQNVYGAVKPGGVFLSETINREELLNRGPYQLWAESSGAITLEAGIFDLVKGRCDTRRIFYDLQTNTRREDTYSVRMFTAAELAEMVRQAGFVDAKFYGGLNQCALTPQSRRLVIVARKRRSGDGAR
jgi:SAM-dependent methyltransferase